MARTSKEKTGIRHARQEQETISFIEINDYLFPCTKHDRQLMLDRGITPAKLPVACLDVLKSTMMKGVKFQLYNWTSTLKSLTKQFVTSMPEGLEAKPGPNHDSDAGVFSVMVFVPSPEAPLEKGQADVFAEAADHHFNNMAHYLARYCHALIKQRQLKDSGTLYLLSIEFNPDIPNAAFFSDGFVSPSIANLHLSPSFRVQMAVETLGEENRQMIAFRHQDLSGDNWNSASQRSFSPKMVKKEEVYMMVNFLLTNFG